MSAESTTLNVNARGLMAIQEDRFSRISRAPTEGEPIVFWYDWDQGF
jgi:hypothetical protein